MKHLASLLLIGGAIAQWHSEVAYDGNFSFLTDPLYQASVPTAHTISKWPAGNLPSICHDHMTFRSCPDANVEVYNVTYTDCARPWVFCRCDSTPDTITRFAEVFGRMPVHMRSRVRHPVMVPSSGPCGGATVWEGDILIQGECPLEVFIHEAGHLIDNTGDVQGQDWSSKPDFVNAMNSDSCSVTNYANTNGRHEVFAEMSVIVTYFMKTGIIPPTSKPSNAGCYTNQLNAIVNRFGHQFYTYGGSCVNRLSDSPTIPAVPARRGRTKRVAAKVVERRYPEDYCGKA